MDVIKKQGLFHLYDRHDTLILTDEKQLDRIIADPNQPIFVDEEKGASGERVLLNENQDTLVSKCKEAAARGCTRFEVSYDFFFGGTKRHNYPSDETTIKAFKVIRDVAKQYGMSFGASILSPLDVGGGWIKKSEETGFSYQYQETEIAPDGSYSVDMLCQQQWYNNKGPIALTPHRVLAYAFNEQRVGDTSYFYVDEDAITDISDTARFDIDWDKSETSGSGWGRCPMRIFGKWEAPRANRVLCIMVYRTPELDYFAPSAKAFMKELLDTHNAAGIDYQGFYSDEMHIQFDWDLGNHFGETELALRYLTPYLGAAYAEKYGEKYRDFAKYLIYMSYHQHDFLPGAAGREPAQHVFAPTAKGIADTWLFRNRYFELLQRTVVDLACWSKDYAEELWGGPIATCAHATWQEGPTCDNFWVPKQRGGMSDNDLAGPEFADVTRESPYERIAAMHKARAAKMKELGISQYDYTPWYDWSSSIRENISGCYDYFKWNEFLMGGGTDHNECGWLDRNYHGQVMAASFSELNKFEKAYCAGWGMPRKVHDLFNNVGYAYGGVYGGDMLQLVTGGGTRRTDVLALYPIKLNNVEERFGSWMVQYGYWNYITEEKLLENAAVNENGTISVNGQQFRCLVVNFEPFLSDKTFALLEQFLAAGGKVLWMSIPALMDANGTDASARFAALFGIQCVCEAGFGQARGGAAVQFAGRFAHLADMKIPTDLLPDRVYPCTPAADGETVATVDGETVAVAKAYPNGGLAVYAGFRVRDDQSCALGQDVNTLSALLTAMGAYRPGSLEMRSRDAAAEYVYNTFANGAIAVAPHYRGITEAWEGKFFRIPELDAASLAGRTDIPDGSICVNEEIAGHAIGYTGSKYLSYLLDEAGAPVGFAGCGTDGITVDGVKYTFADRTADFTFAPVPQRYLNDGISRAIIVSSLTEGVTLTIPATADVAPTVAACTDANPFFGANMPVAHSWDGRNLTFTVTEELAGKQIMIWWS